NRGCSTAGVNIRKLCRAFAWQGPRGAPLAWVWLFARLPLTRADRMGTGPKSNAHLLVWRPGLLSRTAEWRRLQPVLDSDPDRQKPPPRSPPPRKPPPWRPPPWPGACAPVLDAPNKSADPPMKLKP